MVLRAQIFGRLAPIDRSEITSWINDFLQYSHKMDRYGQTFKRLIRTPKKTLVFFWPLWKSGVWNVHFEISTWLGFSSLFSGGNLAPKNPWICVFFQVIFLQIGNSMGCKSPSKKPTICFRIYTFGPFSKHLARQFIATSEEGHPKKR